VFYPKLHKLRCRECRTELKYQVPLWKKMVSLAITMLAGVMGGLVAVVLTVDVDAAFWGWAAYMVLLGLVASYIEAAYVQKRYGPIKA
jgi:hypothetical protein